MRYAEVVKTANEVIEQYDIRLTIRQIYYRLVSDPYLLFPNTPSAYKGFDKIMTRARERGDVDWHRIEDRSRETLGGDWGYSSPKEYLEYKIDGFAECNYTRALWENQPRHVEVWVEKDALAGLFHDAARPYRVLVYPTRGYSSFTKVMEAIEDRLAEAKEKGKDIVLLHFTDHDPSGLQMRDDLAERLASYGGIVGAIKPIALNIAQVKRLRLAPNPTKRADPRSKGYVERYGNSCWELDAVPPDELMRMIKEAIEAEIDRKAWNEQVKRTKRERAELERKLKRMAEKLKKSR